MALGVALGVDAVTPLPLTDQQICQMEDAGLIDRDLSRLARDVTGRNSPPSIAAARRVCSRIWNARNGGAR